MMISFTLTPVEKGVLRCRHTGAFTPEDVRALADFFYDYNGKLLVALPGTSGEECAQHMQRFRPMMPTTAIFGAKIDPSILEISESYYTRKVEYFESEEEALAWLREQ
ncbi:MAG: hypothetical protein H8E28_06785 [Anaerolineae bacterium]|nr:hypothetical protein [Anaerolineae bacterium]